MGTVCKYWLTQGRLRKKWIIYNFFCFCLEAHHKTCILVHKTTFVPTHTKKEIVSEFLKMMVGKSVWGTNRKKVHENENIL